MGQRVPRIQNGYLSKLLKPPLRFNLTVKQGPDWNRCAAKPYIPSRQRQLQPGRELHCGQFLSSNASQIRGRLPAYFQCRLICLEFNADDAADPLLFHAVHVSEHGESLEHVFDDAGGQQHAQLHSAYRACEFLIRSDGRSQHFKLQTAGRAKHQVADC